MIRLIYYKWVSVGGEQETPSTIYFVFSFRSCSLFFFCNFRHSTYVPFCCREQCCRQQHFCVCVSDFNSQSHTHTEKIQQSSVLLCHKFHCLAFKHFPFVCVTFSITLIYTTNTPTHLWLFVMWLNFHFFMYILFSFVIKFWYFTHTNVHTREKCMGW